MIIYLYSCSPCDGIAATFVGVDRLIDVAETEGLVDVAKYTSSMMKVDQTMVKTRVSFSLDIHDLVKTCTD